jgi:hypothetical protein
LKARLTTRLSAVVLAACAFATPAKAETTLEAHYRTQIDQIAASYGWTRGKLEYVNRYYATYYGSNYQMMPNSQTPVIHPGLVIIGGLASMVGTVIFEQAIEAGLKWVVDAITGERNFGKWRCEDCTVVLMPDARMGAEYAAFIKSVVEPHYGNQWKVGDTVQICRGGWCIKLEFSNVNPETPWVPSQKNGPYGYITGDNGGGYKNPYGGSLPPPKNLPKPGAWGQYNNNFLTRLVEAHQEGMLFTRWTITVGGGGSSLVPMTTPTYTVTPGRYNKIE